MQRTKQMLVVRKLGQIDAINGSSCRIQDIVERVKDATGSLDADALSAYARGYLDGLRIVAERK